MQAAVTDFFSEQQCPTWTPLQRILLLVADDVLSQWSLCILTITSTVMVQWTYVRLICLIWLQLLETNLQKGDPFGVAIRFNGKSIPNSVRETLPQNLPESF